MAEKTKSVRTIMRSVRTNEGTEFMVNRTMPQEQLPHLDPFVLLDELGPDVPPGFVEGYGKHPHAGIEVVTYMVDGQMRAGEPNADRDVLLNPKDLGHGVFGGGAMHYEAPMPDVIKNGGRCHGVQLWLSLAKADKYCQPYDGHLAASKVPVYASEDGKIAARVLLGEAFGLRGGLPIKNDVTYLHLTLRPGGSIFAPSPAEHNSFLFVLDGEVTVGTEEQRVRDARIAIFEHDGDVIRVSCPENATAPAEVLLLSGQPHNEPICRAAVFVMNSWPEIQQCFEKYGEALKKNQQKHL